MTAPRELLEEAGGTLSRAEALVGRAAEQLGPPTEDALRILAGDIHRIRRRLRNATTTATATRGRADG